MRLLERKGAVAKVAAVSAIAAECGIPVLHFTQHRTDIAVTRAEQVAGQPCLEDEPERTTIVLIKGRLRAGKVVPKRHIGFVWEGQDHSSTDAVVQGLFGRMCGYEGAFGGTKPLIYLPKALLKRNTGTVVEASEIERHFEPHLYIPRIGRNVLPQRLSKAPEDGKTQCPPLLLDLEEELPPQTTADGKPHKAARKATLLQLLHSAALRRCIEGTDLLLPAQKEELLRELVAAQASIKGRVHVRWFAATASVPYLSFYDSIVEGWRTETASKEGLSKAHPFNFLLVCDGFQARRADAVPGQIYCVFYTKAAGGDVRRPLAACVPLPAPKSIYTFSPESFVPLPAEPVVEPSFRLAMKAYTDPDELRLQLDTVIGLWNDHRRGRRGAIEIDPFLVHKSGLHVFSLQVFAFRSWGNNLLAQALRQLEDKYDCSFAMKRGPVFNGFFSVRKIEWASR
jgi:hypothetical protein